MKHLLAPLVFVLVGTAWASMLLFPSESYWMTSPTPMLTGSPLAKVAVDPEIVSAFAAPLARAAALTPTER